ncbi:uncharacterized protein MAM_04439 [Metarhizium album ARSEF 1941]|uniref:Uncharacterized protein n=1 Tax=Metarhizium album (strain ARSEF 1941) TaxID=1081103 RepID=A0A0B2WUW7_METAS|nr:uncharacterized protein MAM_04439 [Metarhizium album ARSEF 1941]KHN97424.1 hypothetical protein MAM_04439 [Metarhizium album ARSEF 1941]
MARVAETTSVCYPHPACRGKLRDYIGIYEASRVPELPRNRLCICAKDRVPREDDHGQQVYCSHLVAPFHHNHDHHGQEPIHRPSFVQLQPVDYQQRADVVNHQQRADVVNHQQGANVVDDASSPSPSCQALFHQTLVFLDQALPHDRG